MPTPIADPASDPATDDAPGPPADGRDPLYAQVARALRSEIVAGKHPVGSLLPTEDALCARFAVSRHTVREALRRLREDGLVTSRQGAGTVVAAPRAPERLLHATSIADLATFAAETVFDIATMGMVPVSGRLARRIGVASGAEWLGVEGFRHAPGEPPLCRTEYFIARRFAGVARLLRRHRGPIFPLIEDMFAVTIVEVEQEIAAVQVPPPLAEGLHVEAHATALEVRRLYRTGDRAVAQVTINTYPAARFRHSMTMRRVARDG